MRITLKTAAFAAMMAATALTASAEVTAPTVTHDPLMRQIMSRQLTQDSGGVTGAVRIGSGQTITLQVIDPLAPLKPAPGLVAKPAKAKPARKIRRADEQLKKMSGEKRDADWSGVKKP